MCNHVFIYPEDDRENLNPDSMTLTGRCKCGATENSYGVRWAILAEESFKKDVSYGKKCIDNLLELW